MSDLSYVNEAGAKEVEDFENDETEILRLTVELKKLQMICLDRQYNILLRRFPVTQTKCCDRWLLK